MSAILVTGATGQVGGALVRELVRRGARPRAMVRTEEGGETVGARGVEVVVADLERPETLPGALAGVGRSFLMSRDDPRQPQMEGAFVEAAARAGVERIVKLSAQGASPDSPVALMRRHSQAERTLEDSGLGYTVLRPQLYLQNFLRFGPSVAAEGRISAPMGEGRAAQLRRVREGTRRALRLWPFTPHVGQEHRSSYTTGRGAALTRAHRPRAVGRTSVFEKSSKMLSSSCPPRPRP